MSRQLPPTDPFRTATPAPVDQRLSVLAVLAVVTPLVCCIPLTGVLGTIFGAAALISIERSGGRLGGRTLAIVGLMLCLVVTAFQVAVAWGGATAYSRVNHGLVRPAMSAAQAFDRGDAGKARKLLTPQSAARLSDERLDAVRAEIAAKLGAVRPRGQPASAWDLVNEIAGAMSQNQSRVRPGTLPLPLPLDFEKGQAVLLVTPRTPDVLWEIASRGGSIEGQIEDVGLLLDDGTEIWLVGPPPSPMPAAPAPSPPR